MNDRMPERLPRRKQTVTCRQGLDGALLIEAATGQSVALNSTAKAIWDLCDGITTIGELQRVICELFSVSSAQAEADVRAVIAELYEAGLVEWSSSEDAPASNKH